MGLSQSARPQIRVGFLRFPTHQPSNSTATDATKRRCDINISVNPQADSFTLSCPRPGHRRRSQPARGYKSPPLVRAASSPQEFPLRTVHHFSFDGSTKMRQETGCVGPKTVSTHRYFFFLKRTTNFATPPSERRRLGTGEISANGGQLSNIRQPANPVRVLSNRVTDIPFLTRGSRFLLTPSHLTSPLVLAVDR
jgi:hypothetical protein